MTVGKFLSVIFNSDSAKTSHDLYRKCSLSDKEVLNRCYIEVLKYYFLLKLKVETITNGTLE